MTVLDVRYRMGGPPGHPEYPAGHVPGAPYVDLGPDLAARPRRVSGRPPPAAGPGVLGAAMRRAGVAPTGRSWSTTTGRATGPARCWWLLRQDGHDDVRVLDGAWAAWRADGAARRRAAAGRRSGDFLARPGSMPVWRRTTPSAAPA